MSYSEIPLGQFYISYLIDQYTLSKYAAKILGLHGHPYLAPTSTGIGADEGPFPTTST
jgi:hypothetical protein